MNRSWRRRGAALAFAAVATIGVAACGDDSGSSSGGDTPTTTTGSTAASTDTTTGSSETTGDVTIVIKDVSFTTPDVTVKAGQSVTWDNQDNQAHTATGQGSGAFATDTIAPGTKKTVTFDEAGTFPFICSFHPFMKGTVTVE